MSNVVGEQFEEFNNSKENFNIFHNQIINMPRDEFSSAGMKKLRSLCAYLLLIEFRVDIKEGNNYKEILQLIIDQRPFDEISLELRTEEYEHRYFRSDIEIDKLYDEQGRMFRHLMGICSFFGIITSKSKQKKIVDFNVCKEYVLSDYETLIPVLRNHLLNININDNDYINNLTGINIDKKIANYKPAYAILKYISMLKRDPTIFEVSILLGRIDNNNQDFNSIFNRALKIGLQLPDNQEEQILFVLGSLGWKDISGRIFQYANSQEPYFKFKSFILYMVAFGLIDYDRINSKIQLTEYSKSILKEEIPFELLDLQELLSKIDDDSEKNAELFDLIIRKRSQYITDQIQQDSDLIEKMNKRSLRSPEIDNSGKRKRNRLIAELAKIKADYTCEATGLKTFKMTNGLYYVEAHHIIEFSTEDGPDITDNLIALGPEKHKLLHLGSKEEIDNLYRHLISNGILTVNRFIKMHETYRCLTYNHINSLYSRKIISSFDKDKLLTLIQDNQNEVINL